MQSSAAKIVTTLLADLRTSHWSHWTSLWQVKGNTYYGDHLLLERIYTAVTDEIDTLAEKCVAFYGAESVDPVAQANMMADMLVHHAEADPIMRALKIERFLQTMFAEVFDELEASGQMSLGLNDFIAAAANAHETAIYLLQQRTR